MRSSQTTLGGRLTLRLALVMVLAFVLQTLLVVWEYGRDTDTLERSAIAYDIDRIIATMRDAPAGAPPILPRDLSSRLETHPRNYAVEILGGDGRMILERNGEVFADAPLLDATIHLDMTWYEDVVAEGTRRVLSKRIDDPATGTVVRIAYVDDPAAAYWNIFVAETMDHVVEPGVPVAVAVVLVGLLVVRRSLAPLARAAAAAAAVDPRHNRFRIGAAGLPAEVAALGGAVDRLLERIEEVTRSHAAFAGNVAHELRTPLALLSLELDAIGGERVLRAKQDVHELARLVDQLLHIARLDVLEPGPDDRFDLAEIAADVVTRLAPIAIANGRDLALTAADTTTVPGNREAMVSALRNLVENALRVSPAGGVVEVVVGPGPTIAVLDEGPGLPPEGAERLFAPNVQGDRSTRGRAGLGLAIVAKTMEVHGGHVVATDRPNGGACFRLDFAVFRSTVDRT